MYRRNFHHCSRSSARWASTSAAKWLYVVRLADVSGGIRSTWPYRLRLAVKTISLGTTSTPPGTVPRSKYNEANICRSFGIWYDDGGTHLGDVVIRLTILIYLCCTLTVTLARQELRNVVVARHIPEPQCPQLRKATLASCFPEERPKHACHAALFLYAVCVSDDVCLFVFHALIVSDHSAKQAGAISSISARNEPNAKTRRNTYRLRTRRRAVGWRQWSTRREMRSLVIECRLDGKYAK